MGAVKRMVEDKSEEIAGQRYSREFNDLSPQLQFQVWTEAERVVVDDLYAKADLRRDGQGNTPWDELELMRRLGK